MTCAWRLRQRGVPVLLLERGPRFGGLIGTVRKNGFLFDVGPQSLLAIQPLAAVIEELGLSGKLLRADPRAPRYILSKGRLVRAPLSPPELIRTSLIGWHTKLRLLGEPFRWTRPPQDDESIAAFVRRKFGENLLANLAAPFVSGVYAGDPEKLSLRSCFPAVHRFEQQYGSVLRGAMKSRRHGHKDHKDSGHPASLCNFKRGIPTLTEALTQKLEDSARTGAEVVTIHRRHPDSGGDNSGGPGGTDSGGPGGFGKFDGFDITWTTDNAMTQQLQVLAVVLATPAGRAAKLLAAINPGFAEALLRIEYAPLAQVSSGYRLAQISARMDNRPLRGFGFLVPRTEGMRLLGTVFNSFLFPSRAPDAPEPMASFTSFIGGATDPDLPAQSEETIAATVRKEIASVLGIAGVPVAEHVSRWDRALPQYNLGHQRIVTALEDLCANTPGVFLTGNYLSGPAIGSCIEQAQSTADAVARFCAAQR